MRTLNPTLQYIASRETRIAVWEYAGEEPPLFFCHCAGLCGRTWDPVIRRLGLNNRILAWDARGHGDSGVPSYPGAYAWDGFSRDLLDVMDALGLKQDVWAVGHSGGASTIVHAALTDPARFSRIVLMDAIIAPLAWYEGARYLSALTRKRRHVMHSIEEARARFGAKEPMNRWHGEVLEAYLAHGFSCDAAGRLHLKCKGEVEAQVYECGGMVLMYDRLAEVDTPALAVTASDSYMLEYVRGQAARLPHAKLVELAETGHFIPQERPEACADLISDWFARS